MAKHPGGRPTKYKPEYCKKIVEYFSCELTKIVGNKVLPNDLPTLSGFAFSIGVNQDTLHEWTSVHPEFSEAFNIAKQKQKDFLVANGLAGLYPPASFIFVAKNITDMRDKTEVEHSGGISLTDLFNKANEQKEGHPKE